MATEISSDKEFTDVLNSINKAGDEQLALKKKLNPSQLSWWSSPDNSFKIYDPDTDKRHTASLEKEGRVSFSPNYDFNLLNKDRINVDGKTQIPTWLLPYSSPSPTTFTLDNAPDDLKQ